MRDLPEERALAAKKHLITLGEMKAWLNSNNGSLFRDIHITGHAHGVRVTLSEEHGDITSSVGENITTAFNDCLRNYDEAKANNNKREVQHLEERIAEQERELSSLHNRLEKWERETRKKDREDLLNDPARCLEIKQSAINRGWNGQKILEQDETYNKTVVENLASDFGIRTIVITELLNNEPHFKEVITEFIVTNHVW